MEAQPNPARKIPVMATFKVVEKMSTVVPKAVQTGSAPRTKGRFGDRQQSQWSKRASCCKPGGRKNIGASVVMFVIPFAMRRSIPQPHTPNARFMQT